MSSNYQKDLRTDCNNLFKNAIDTLLKGVELTLRCWHNCAIL
ncbi:MAG: hypothetical protein JWL77_347 [Chthonomonadaceae bacterium]|nr:hypothetical protein [Chthonomonadaceae bacterium]